MNEKEFAQLKAGDKVRIALKKSGGYWNPNGEMDKWLGQVMTVSYRTDAERIKMEEDNRHWSWRAEMLEEKVPPQQPACPKDEQPASEKQNFKEIKRFAKKGEYIRIIETDFEEGSLPIGTILRVIGTCATPLFKGTLYAISEKKEIIRMFPTQYVVLEKCGQNSVFEAFLNQVPEPHIQINICALSPTFELIKKVVCPNLEYFVPCCKLGIPTPYKDSRESPLFLGDIVEIYNADTSEYIATQPVISGDNFGKKKPFVFSIEKSCDALTGTISNFNIRKVRDYTELKNGERTGFFKYVSTPEK